MKPHVVIVGADKGGVGKTTISRTLMNYFSAHGISVRAFDTEHPNGTLARFHKEAQIVNLEESDDQMKVFDHLNTAQVTLIDIRAALLSKTLATLTEIGFLGGSRASRMKTSVVHVIGSNKASFDEIETTAKAVEGADHYVVLNHTNKSKFMGLPEAVKNPIVIGQLNELAAETVDGLGVSFDAFIGDQTQSPVLQGYVDAWLTRARKAYDDKGLNAL
ncbi:division plane positioning ATPase MipZ [Bradyrhizobium sp. PMVTL-01]|uniref:nucleotide-binding protein n=1 Tax=Bradyrhizobium sp. PMVTL-01 TaxID=3434999 RepID=UPI003F730D0F